MRSGVCWDYIGLQKSPGNGRVDHISKKCAKQYSKLFIPFLDMRIDTKKNCSSIRDELGVPQAPFSFSCGLRGGISPKY